MDVKKSSLIQRFLKRDSQEDTLHESSSQENDENMYLNYVHSQNPHQRPRETLHGKALLSSEKLTIRNSSGTPVGPVNFTDEDQQIPSPGIISFASFYQIHPLCFRRKQESRHDLKR